MANTQAVYGVRTTMAELRAIEPKLRTQAQRDVKAAARPLQDAVSSRLGTDAPLSGMRHKGRTGWYAGGSHRVRTKYGGRKDKAKDQWPLLSVILAGAAGSIVDMAGRKGSSTPAGRALVSGLNSRKGSASRAAWPAAEQHMQAVQAAVLAAVQKVQQQANPRLSTVTKAP